MSTYEIGQTITVSVTVKDANDALVAVGGTITCTVTLPDGTTTGATVTTTSTGIYQATYISTQAGRHRFTWAATGTYSTGFPYTDQADVWPADPRMIISLADAREGMNTPAARTADDDELRLYLASATDILEDLCADLDIAVYPTARSEIHTPRTENLCLRHKPVGAVTSVTEYIGTASYVIPVAATPGASGHTYTIDTASGILTRRLGGWPFTWRGEVQVLYTEGSTTIPPRVILAARELVAHLFTLGQWGSRKSFGDIDTTVTTGRGYAVPNRVVQILDPADSAVSGIA